MSVARGLVFITGASSGIGQALARRYAQDGWRLALVGRRAAELTAWAEAQGWPGERWRVYGADVAQVDAIVAAGQACLAQQGVPDVVIASAGISIGVDTAVRGDLQVMARIFATNNLGLAASFQPFIAPMRRRGSGTYVAEPAESRILFQYFRLVPDSDEASFPDSRVLHWSREKADETDRVSLALPHGSDVWRIARVRDLGGVPVIAETISLSAMRWSPRRRCSTRSRSMPPMRQAGWWRSMLR